MTWSIPEQYPYDGRDANYWIAPDNMQGEFILRFDQPRTVDTIRMVNARNNNDRGTNEFKVTNAITSTQTQIVFLTHIESTFHIPN